MNEPVPVYGAVPPVADTSTVVVPPLHNIVPGNELDDNAVGSDTFPVVVEVHPFASVTV